MAFIKSEIKENEQGASIKGILRADFGNEIHQALIYIVRKNLNELMVLVKNRVISRFLSGPPRLKPSSRGAALNVGLGKLSGNLIANTRIDERAHTTTESHITRQGGSQSRYAGHVSRLVIGEGLPYTPMWVRETYVDKDIEKHIVPRTAKMLTIPILGKARFGLGSDIGAGMIKAKYRFPKKSGLKAGSVSEDTLVKLEVFPAGKGSNRKHPVLGKRINKGWYKPGIDPYFLLVPFVRARGKVALEEMMDDSVVKGLFQVYKDKCTHDITARWDAAIRKFRKTGLKDTLLTRGFK